MKMLLDAGLLHGDFLTVTGRTIAENLQDVKPYPADQDVVRPLAKPKKPRATRGVLAKYAKFVATSSEGAVTDKYL